MTQVFSLSDGYDEYSVGLDPKELKIGICCYQCTIEYYHFRFSEFVSKSYGCCMNSQNRFLMINVHFM